MSSDANIAVSIRALSKSYVIAHQSAQRHSTLTETLLSRARNPFRRPPSETFWALRDVAFDIPAGDVVGIIGRNGAGKSTLLKILSRITEPTSGQVDLYGRVGSLLEVGTGFHPELTGRENIDLNGAILGMTRAEIRSQFDAIVDFAGVERFLDTPVKRYSSGMYVRLAFAVAAHLQSEILIIDEVLAVGDADFQAKCLGKMRDLSRAEGRTVLLVTHNLATVESFCKDVIHLADGRVANFGPAADILRTYARDHQQAFNAEGQAGVFPMRDPRTGIRIKSFSIDVQRNETSADRRIDAIVDCEIDFPNPIERLGIGLRFHDPDGRLVAQLWPGIAMPDFGRRPAGSFAVRMTIPNVVSQLAAGTYHVGVSVHEVHALTLVVRDQIGVLHVPETDIYGSGFPFLLSQSGPVPLQIDSVELGTSQT